MNPTDAVGAGLIAAALAADYALIRGGYDSLTSRAATNALRGGVLVYVFLHLLRVIPRPADPLCRIADRIRGA